MPQCHSTQRHSTQRPYSIQRSATTQRDQSTFPHQDTFKYQGPFKHHPLPFMLVLAGLMLLLSACGPRATGGNTIELAEEYTAAVDLPAIVIDYDVEGVPSVGGLPLSGVMGLFGLSADSAALLQLDPALVTHLTKANIQHIQLDNSTNGIILLVNGEPIPSLVWDDDSLVAMAEVMDMAGFGIELLDTVLPLIQTVGVGTIIRFPAAEDAPLIPTVVSGGERAVESMTARQSAFQETVGSTAQLQVIVSYAEDGQWTVAGMDATQWAQILPAPWADLNLPPSVVAQLSERGVATIGFATNQDGLFVSVNDKTLPYLAWGQGELQHLLALLSGPETIAYLTGGNGSGLDQLMPIAEQWLPVLQMADTRITVTFPY